MQSRLIDLRFIYYWSIFMRAIGHTMQLPVFTWCNASYWYVKIAKKITDRTIFGES